MNEMTFQYLFSLSMKRQLHNIPYITEGKIFDIGSSGIFKVPGAISLGLPDWNWPRDTIPSLNEEVKAIHCYHFLEHLSGEDAISFLRDAQRVLAPNGIMYFCMPYYNSNLMAQDLTHKSFWNEESFRNIFNNKFYNPAGEWKLKVGFQLICGIVERNLALIGYLQKV